MTTSSDVPAGTPQAQAADEATLAQQRLVEALRSGDGDAFATLVRDYGPAMLATARRMLGNEDDARDALQESLLAAFRSIATFAARAQLSTWLHRIVVNTVLMKLRSRRSRPECALDDLLPRFQEDGHHVDPPCPWSDHAERDLMRGENKELLWAAMDRLPAAAREVLVLRDIEDLSTEAAAQVLGITANAVKIRLHRARQALRTLLDRHFKDQQP